MPKSTPTSSSAVSASSRSPGSRTPSRASEAKATAAAATWPFMSSAPRPQTSPSTRSPDHGSRDHSSGSASTVSVCAIRSRLGPSPPGRRATRFARSGVLRDELARGCRSGRGSRGRSSAARVSLPGGLTVSRRRSSWRSSVTSSRSVTPLRPCDRAVSSFRTCPELREEDGLDEPAEHLDGRPLRADDAVADHAGDDAVVADAPLLAPLVELDERLGEPVQRVVLAPLDVERRRARGPPSRRRAWNACAEARQRGAQRCASRASRSRSRARAPCGSPGTPTGESSSSMSSWSVTNRRQRSGRRSRRAASATSPSSASRAASSTSLVASFSQSSDGLVDDLEEQLVAVHPLVGALLEREQLLGVEVALVVARRRARQDRRVEVLAGGGHRA